MTVWLSIESDRPDWIAARGFSQDPWSDLVLRFVPDFDTEPFRRHWTAMRDLDPPLAWTRMTLIVEGDGEFHIDYGYDPVPLVDRVERAERWQARYLPAGARIA